MYIVGRPRFLRRRWVLTAGVYGALWLLTATWGNSSVDNRFDREFTPAYDTSLSDDTPTTTVRLRRFNVHDPHDSENWSGLPDEPRFRYRSRGLAVAPFIIIDRIAAVQASLYGIGATRVNVWFFGYTRWWAVHTWWMV